jgi:N-acetylmuramoyl-L-alanine amidase
MRQKPDSPFASKIFPSPNHGERKDGKSINSVILHYTGMSTADGALKWLCNPISNVSCHYFIFEDGRILQLVPEARRAWHAGASNWHGETDINSVSLGIEIVNQGHEGGSPPFPEMQIEATIKLVQDITKRWQIPQTRVLAHSDIAPTRKPDPGEMFPWGQLYQAGIGHWVAPVPIKGGRFFSLGDEGAPIEALQSMLALYGYGLEINGIYDPQTKAVITAFQRHYRPAQVDGIADHSTITTLRNLINMVGTTGIEPVTTTMSM